MEETFSSTVRNLDWVAWEMKFTASSGTSVTPNFLAETRKTQMLWKYINNQTKHITAQMFGRKFSERKLHLSYLINPPQKGPICVEKIKGCYGELTRPAFKTQICWEVVLQLLWLIFKPDFLKFQKIEFGWASVVWKVSNPDPTTQKSWGDLKQQLCLICFSWNFLSKKKLD